MKPMAILPGPAPSRTMIGALLLSLAIHAGAGAIVSGIWSPTAPAGDPVALDAIDAELLEAGAVGTGAVVEAPEPAGRTPAPAATGAERAEAVDPPRVVPTLDVAPEAVAAIAPPPLTAPAETATVDRSLPPSRVDEVVPSEPDPTLVTSAAADMPPPEQEASAPEARLAEPAPIAPALAARSPAASADAAIVPPGPAAPPAPARAAATDAPPEATDPAILPAPLAAAIRPAPEPKPAAETKPAPEPAREPKPAAPSRARPEPTRPRSVAAAPPPDRSSTRPKADGGPTGALAPHPPGPARTATAVGGGVPAGGRSETARPAARAAGSGDAADPIARYMAAVRARIVSRQQPGDGSQGTVVVSFEVRRDGGLEQIAAISGGTGDLKSAAIRIVRAAAPAPPFPDTIGAARLRMTVALRFE